jgi:8-amino-7-oxononanoate synthase
VNPRRDPLAWLDLEAARRQSEGKERRLARELGPGVSFASNDYLGLRDDPRVIAAAVAAAEKFGWGAGASPLVSGWLPPHDELAREIARFERTEAVAIYPSGFAANLGAIAALVSAGDAVYVDRLNHASLIDGVRLSGARMRVYPHDDSDRLAQLLARDSGRFRRSLIATDGVFSMDGDLAPLAELAELSERFGAMLLVDEAHATGVLGPGGRGTAAHFGMEDRVDIKVGTLSKALGSIGGFVAGSRRLVDHLTNHSRTLIYSTGLPPAAAAAASRALAIVEAEPWRREHLIRLTERFRAALGLARTPQLTPIVPIVVGDPGRAVDASAALREQGLFVPAIRPPTVPANTSRLRVSLSSRHTEADVDRLATAIVALGLTAPA